MYFIIKEYLWSSELNFLFHLFFPLLILQRAIWVYFFPLHGRFVVFTRAAKSKITWR